MSVIEREPGVYEWRGRSQLDEIIDMERAATRGILGPFEQWKLREERSPERVKQALRRAGLAALGEIPALEATSSPFAAPVGNPGANPSSFTAVNTTNVETNLWTPAIWTPIPANDMQPGRIYDVSGGGIFSTSSAAPTSTWTPRCGQSATPSSNIALGASTGTTMIASLASVPWFFMFRLAIRALGLAASGGSGTGNGFVTLGGLTTAAGIIQDIGATVAATLDNTAATGLILSQTWGTNAAANSVQAQWVSPVRSLN